MKKLTIEHSEAVGAAKLLLQHKTTGNIDPRYRQFIEGQIKLLRDVNWLVLHSLFNPSLPFDDTKLDADLKELHKNHEKPPAEQEGVKHFGPATG